VLILILLSAALLLGLSGCKFVGVSGPTAAPPTPYPTYTPYPTPSPLARFHEVEAIARLHKFFIQTSTDLLIETGELAKEYCVKGQGCPDWLKDFTGPVIRQRVQMEARYTAMDSNNVSAEYQGHGAWLITIHGITILSETEESYIPEETWWFFESGDIGPKLAR